jgi:hypothetical protein
MQLSAQNAEAIKKFINYLKKFAEENGKDAKEYSKSTLVAKLKKTGLNLKYNKHRDNIGNHYFTFDTIKDSEDIHLAIGDGSYIVDTKNKKIFLRFGKMPEDVRLIFASTLEDDFLHLDIWDYEGGRKGEPLKPLYYDYGFKRDIRFKALDFAIRGNKVYNFEIGNHALYEGELEWMLEGAETISGFLKESFPKFKSLKDFGFKVEPSLSSTIKSLPENKPATGAGQPILLR